MRIEESSPVLHSERIGKEFVSFLAVGELVCLALWLRGTRSDIRSLRQTPAAVKETFQGREEHFI